MVIASALLAVKMTVSGISAFVPSKKDPSLVRVVIPNGRVVTDFNPGLEIPSHVAYVMFDIKDLAPGSRQPDFTYTFKNPTLRTFGVVLIESESLEVGGNFQRKPLEFDAKPSTLTAPKPDSTNQNSMHWMFDHRLANPGIPLDLRVLKPLPDGKRVALRMDLRYGKFAIEPASIGSKVFVVTKDSPEVPGRCQELARGVSVTLATKAGSDRQTLTLTSAPLGGQATPLPLKLSRKTADGDLHVLIGNEPVNEVEASAALLGATVETMPMGSGKIIPHMLIMERLLKPHQDPPFTPFSIPDDKCSAQGLVKHSQPPQGYKGLSGGCAPFIIVVADPAG